MLDRLPVYIQPLSFSERRKAFSGVVEISAFTRLSDLLQDTAGTVDIDLSFEKEGKAPTVQGNIKADLELECQTCLHPFVLSIDKDFKLGFVKSLEQADRLASDCEPFIFEGDKVSLIELIEDEMLLALPDFPRHNYRCVEKKEESVEAVNNGEQLRSDNPFSVLAKLKNTGD